MTKKQHTQIKIILNYFRCLKEGSYPQGMLTVKGLTIQDVEQLVTEFEKEQPEQVDEQQQEKQKIEVPLTEEDLQDLMSGEVFNWSFPDQNGKWIDVRVFQGNELEE